MVCCVLGVALQTLKNYIHHRNAFVLWWWRPCCALCSTGWRVELVLLLFVVWVLRIHFSSIFWWCWDELKLYHVLLYSSWRCGVCLYASLCLFQCDTVLIPNLASAWFSRIVESIALILCTCGVKMWGGRESEVNLQSRKLWMGMGGFVCECVDVLSMQAWNRSRWCNRETGLCSLSNKNVIMSSTDSVHALLVTWLAHVIKNKSNHLDIWFDFLAVFGHFWQCCESVSITDKSLKRKLNKLSKINRHFHKKDEYSKSQNRYVTYYLISDNFYTQQNVELQCTIHSLVMNNYKQINKQVSVQVDTHPSKVNEIYSKKSDSILSQNKWMSPEALKFFLPPCFTKNKKDEDNNVSNQEERIKDSIKGPLTMDLSVDSLLWLLGDQLSFSSYHLPRM